MSTGDKAIDTISDNQKENVSTAPNREGHDAIRPFSTRPLSLSLTEWRTSSRTPHIDTNVALNSKAVCTYEDTVFNAEPWANTIVPSSQPSHEIVDVATERSLPKSAKPQNRPISTTQNVKPRAVTKFADRYTDRREVLETLQDPLIEVDPVSHPTQGRSSSSEGLTGTDDANNTTETLPLLDSQTDLMTSGDIPELQYPTLCSLPRTDRLDTRQEMLMPVADELTIVERLQDFKLEDANTLRNTMRQRKPGNTKTKKKKKKKKHEVTPEAVLPMPDWHTSINVPKTRKDSSSGKLHHPGQAQGKSDHAFNHSDVVTNDIRCILQRARGTRGVVALKCRVGRVLLSNVEHGKSRTFGKFPMAAQEAEQYLKDQEDTGAIQTCFTHMLTARQTEADYIAALSYSDGTRMFSEEAVDNCAWYEIICNDEGKRELRIQVKGGGRFALAYPEDDNGKIYLHYPKRQWDACMSSTVKKSSLRLADSVPGSTNDHIKHATAIEGIVQSFSAECRGTEDTDRLTIRFKNESKELSVDGIIAKRMLTYASMKDDRLLLNLVEVQNLKVGINTSDPTVFRARTSSRLAMTESGNLWYEATVSATIHHFLENRELEVGTVATWTADDILASGIVDEMTTLTEHIVTRIDRVGAGNRGPRGHAEDLRAMRRKEQDRKEKLVEAMDYFW